MRRRNRLVVAVAPPLHVAWGRHKATEVGGDGGNTTYRCQCKEVLSLWTSHRIKAHDRRR